MSSSQQLALGNGLASKVLASGLLGGQSRSSKLTSPKHLPQGVQDCDILHQGSPSKIITLYSLLSLSDQHAPGTIGTSGHQCDMFTTLLFLLKSDHLRGFAKNAFSQAIPATGSCSLHE